MKNTDYVGYIWLQTQTIKRGGKNPHSIKPTNLERHAKANAISWLTYDKLALGLVALAVFSIV